MRIWEGEGRIYTRRKQCFGPKPRFSGPFVAGGIMRWDAHFNRLADNYLVILIGNIISFFSFSFFFSFPFTLLGTKTIQKLEFSFSRILIFWLDFPIAQVETNFKSSSRINL